MSIINVHNYEAFVLDFLEGNLSVALAQELMAFAQEHPELNLELDAELVYLNPSEDTFDNKELMKSSADIEELIVAKIDHELTAQDEIKLNFYQNEYPELVKMTEKEFKGTLLSSDETILFPGKKELKKPLVLPIYWQTAVAASMIGFVFMLVGPEKSKREYSAGYEMSVVNKVEAQLSTAIEEQEIDEQFVSEGIFEDNNQIAVFSKDIVKENIDSLVTEKELDDEELQDNFVSNQNEQIASNEIAVPVDTTQLVPSIATNVDTLEIENLDDYDNVAEHSQPIVFKDFVKQKTKQIITNDKEIAQNDQSVLETLATNLNQKTDYEVAYANSEVDDKKITKIKFGKFEFYKSSSK